jgi:hypothetical protein
MRRIALTFALVASAACDNVISPNKSLTATSARFGDFIVRAENYRFPDSLKFGDTTLVTFDIGGGEDPCSFNGHITLWTAKAYYFVPWGVRHPGDSCRIPAFRLYGPVGLSDGRGFPPPDTLVEGYTVRMIVCYPDGSFRRSDVRFVFPWPSRVDPVDTMEKSRREDERTCQGYATLQGKS